MYCSIDQFTLQTLKFDGYYYEIVVIYHKNIVAIILLISQIYMDRM